MGMNSTEKLFVTEKNKIKRCCLFKNQNDPLSAGESRFLLLLLLLGTLQNNNSMGPINRLTYFLPAWVKLCVFIRALQLKMGTRFAELGQENMPPLLPPIFLYLLLSGGALQTTKCLLHPPSKPSLHRLASHGALASAFPLKQLPPASPSSAFLSLQCSLGVSMPSFRQGCTSSLEYNWKQNLIVLSSRSCFYY